MKRQLLSVFFALLVVLASTAIRKGFANAVSSGNVWNSSSPFSAQPISRATHTLPLGITPAPTSSTQNNTASIGATPVPVPPYRTEASIGATPVPVPPYRTEASIGATPVPVPPYRTEASIGATPVPVPPYKA